MFLIVGPYLVNSPRLPRPAILDRQPPASQNYCVNILFDNELQCTYWPPLKGALYYNAHGSSPTILLMIGHIERSQFVVRASTLPSIIISESKRSHRWEAVDLRSLSLLLYTGYGCL